MEHDQSLAQEYNAASRPGTGELGGGTQPVRSLADAIKSRVARIVPLTRHNGVSLRASAKAGDLHVSQQVEEGVRMAKAAKGTKQNEDFLHLDNQLCFALHAAARAVCKAYMETLGGAKLTYPQYLVLIVLLENEQLSVSELGKLLHLNSGTLTPLLKRMEANGYVTRKRSTVDEREVYISLTAKGRGLRKVAKQARVLMVERLDMSEREIRALRQELMNITNRLLEAQETQGAQVRQGSVRRTTPPCRLRLEN